MGQIFFFSLVRGRLAIQNDLFWFFRHKKPRSWQRIPLETHFEPFWGFLKKSIFSTLRGQKGTKNVKKIEISKKMIMSALGD